MNGAKEIVEKIRMDLKPLDEKILGHAYIKGLTEGKLSQDSLRTFAGQQYHIITSDLRNIAGLLSRHGQLPSRPWLIALLLGEAGALDALLTFAEKLSMGESDLRSFEPIPAAHAYCTIVPMLPG